MLEVNGKSYLRVSEVLRPFYNFEGIDKEVLEKKAMLGRLVHECISEEIQGHFPVVSGKVVGYFKSFKRWEDTVRPHFIASEVRYCCDKKMLTGAIDALVEFEGEKEAVLVDFKTSAQESPITWPMQAHLYRYLLANAGKVIGKYCLFIKLDRYGDYPRVFQYKFNTSLTDRCLQLVDEMRNSDSCVNNCVEFVDSRQQKPPELQSEGKRTEKTE
jgi:hypothetical protein